MKSVVIAYEDHYCRELHGFIKALRGDHGLAGIVLEARTVNGTGNFVSEVPKLLRMRLAKTKALPDRVVCLADADRAGNLVPEAHGAPEGTDSAGLEQWLAEFEPRWFGHLVDGGRLDPEQAARLAVCCIRWSKESLLVACPDALLEYAGDRRLLVQALLDDCVPAPAMLADVDYPVHYRNPATCLDRVIRVVLGRSYKKGLHDEDLLRERLHPVPARRAEVERRCPDLGRLITLLGFPPE